VMDVADAVEASVPSKLTDIMHIVLALFTAESARSLFSSESLSRQNAF